MPASGPIQTLPAGLLAALDLKNTGKNPQDLLDTVQPVMDLTHWYRARDVEFVQGTVGIVQGVLYATGLQFNVPQVVVPDGELWWVRDFLVTVEGDVATITLFNVFQLAPMMIYREGSATLGRHRLMGDSVAPVTSAAIGGVPGIGLQVQAGSLRDFWAPAGATFGCQFIGSYNDPASSLKVVGTLRIDRFRI